MVNPGFSGFSVSIKCIGDQFTLFMAEKDFSAEIRSTEVTPDHDTNTTDIHGVQ